MRTNLPLCWLAWLDDEFGYLYWLDDLMNEPVYVFESFLRLFLSRFVHLIFLWEWHLVD